MGQIIYCSDLVLRIDSEEEVHNITGTIHILRNQISGFLDPPPPYVLNTQYMTNSTMVSPVKMEYG